MRKALNVIKNIFVGLIVLLAVSMMIFTIVSVNTFDRSDRSLFGYKAFIVLSDSMSKTDFSVGDLVLIKEVDPSTLKEGDIIAYTSQNTSNYGETVTHKIRRLTTDANGEPGFITYGTTTDTDDETVVTYPYVLGKYQTHIPNVGRFFMFLKTTPGYILCILMPFLVLILMQGLNCIRLFQRYKQEQLDEMIAERAKLEEERAESQKLIGRASGSESTACRPENRKRRQRNGHVAKGIRRYGRIVGKLFYKNTDFTADKSAGIRLV